MDEETNYSEILDKFKSLSKRTTEVEREVKELKELKHKLKAELQELKKQRDQNSQNWRRLIDFSVQLIWVAMAAWLLTHLGLQAPL
jgi:uncharacterized coiled-coil DUF342 family protein